MDVHDFIKWVKKENKTGNGNMILVWVGFVCIGMLRIFERNWLFTILFELLFLVATLELSRYEWNQYLLLRKTKENKSIDLVQILRNHSFSAEKYFAGVKYEMQTTVTRIMTFSVTTALITVLGNKTLFSWKKVLLYIIVLLLQIKCPAFVGWIKQKIWIYQSKMGTKGKGNRSLFIIGKIVTILERFLLMGMLLVICFLIAVIIESMASPNLNPSVITLRTQHHAWGFIAIVFVLILTLLKLTVGFKIVLKQKVRNGLIAFAFILVLSMCLLDGYSYTDFGTNKIVVRTVFHKKEYKLTDVKAFTVFDDKNHTIQLKLVLKEKDGDLRTIKLFGASQTYSELYSKTYPNDYAFVAFYTLLLQQAGAKGQMKDIGQLRKDVAKENTSAQKSLEQIIRKVHIANANE